MRAYKPIHRKWWKTFCWYAYQLSMISVCCITIALVLANKVKLQITLDKSTTILLTTIGFLFAFAGINIYSIFNTNIEEEKGRLRDLQNEYEDAMRFEKKQGENARKLLVYYQTCQMVIDSQFFNPQIYDWLFDLRRYIAECKDFILLLYTEKRESSYVTFRDDFRYISRGIKIQLRAFEDRIKDRRSTFFNTVTESDKRNFFTVFDEVINEVKSLEDYDYTGKKRKKNVVKEPQLLKDRLIAVWISLKNVFRQS